MSTAISFREPIDARKRRAELRYKFIPRAVVQGAAWSSLAMLLIGAAGPLHFIPHYRIQVDAGEYTGSLLGDFYTSSIPGLVFVLGLLCLGTLAYQRWGWLIPHFVRFTEDALVYAHGLVPVQLFWSEAGEFELLERGVAADGPMLCLLTRGRALTCVGIAPRVSQEQIEAFLLEKGWSRATGIWHEAQALEPA